ncbi:hypothetical protein OPV22_024460 [Ensete ventricosum]|uniref:RING-type domain-containing protein n=1 Tax=Ensete ventricosum TaxID=4639 RepID=A0AAV8QEZ5_ENSVE|nr:hypothetical protein OPV22_024460 [Ensete ventricosum]
MARHLGGRGTNGVGISLGIPVWRVPSWDETHAEIGSLEFCFLSTPDLLAHHECCSKVIDITMVETSDLVTYSTFDGTEASICFGGQSRSPQPSFTSQPLLRSRNQPSSHTMQMGFLSPVSGAAAAPGSGLGFKSVASAKVLAPRKRLRPVSFLGDDMSSHLQQQVLDMDRLILQHAERARAELTERRKRFTRQILAALEEGMSKRLRASQEEIARLGKMNWALEERIKSLCVENQMWRDMARSNEATANALRTNLEQFIAAQEAAATAADAESCCCVGDDGEAEAGARRSACRICHDGEPSVLLLPCRHLCLCAACGPAVDACPVCQCSKNGSVCINMS